MHALASPSPCANLEPRCACSDVGKWYQVAWRPCGWGVSACSFARDRGVASAKDARERPGPCHVYVPGFLPFRNVVGWLSRGRLDFVASPQPTGWAAHGGMESSCAAPARRANAIY
jgi:hypothetical protein